MTSCTPADAGQRDHLLHRQLGQIGRVFPQTSIKSRVSDQSVTDQAMLIVLWIGKYESHQLRLSRAYFHRISVRKEWRWVRTRDCLNCGCVILYSRLKKAAILMFNVIWTLMILISATAAIWNGKVEFMVSHIPVHANRAIEISISLIGIMAFWLGLMKIAEDCGAVRMLARLLQPVMRRLFPDIPGDHPAMGAMTFSIVSSMLGLNNASIPISIRAMQALQKLNPDPAAASNAMCLFLVITSSSVQLLPTTAIAALAKAGSLDPTKIIITTLLATIFSTLGSIVACLMLQGRSSKEEYV